MPASRVDDRVICVLEVEAELEGDTWTVTIDGSDVYEVPLAAIEGG